MVDRFGLAVNEDDFFLYHVVDFLFAHHTADHIRLTERVPRKSLNDFHNLFLIDYTAVGLFEYGFEQRVSVRHEFGVVLALYEFGYGVHRTGAVKRNRRDYIFYAGRFEFSKEALEASRFYLKHGFRVARRKHRENFRVVVRRVVEVYLYAVVLFDVFDSHLDIGQVS